MAKSGDVKLRLLESMGAHVLAHGLNTASLRPLAKAASTSDRMLVYHFGTKEALIAELLQHLAGDLRHKLDSALPQRRARSNSKYIADVVALLRKEPYRSYMRVWFDIVSTASHGSENHKAIGKKMIDGYMEWLEIRLPESGRDPKATLALIFTVIEGVLVMDAVGQSKLADLALKGVFDN